MNSGLTPWCDRNSDKLSLNLFYNSKIVNISFTERQPRKGSFIGNHLIVHKAVVSIFECPGILSE